MTPCQDHYFVRHDTSRVYHCPNCKATITEKALMEQQNKEKK